MLHSLKWRIQFWHALILGLVLCILSVGFYHYEKGRRMAEVDQLLDQEIPPFMSLSGPYRRSALDAMRIGPLLRSTGRPSNRLMAPINGDRPPPRESERDRRRMDGGGRPRPTEDGQLPPGTPPLAAEPVPPGWKLRETPLTFIAGGEGFGNPGPGIEYFESKLIPLGFYALAVHPRSGEELYRSYNFPDIEMPDTRMPRYMMRIRDDRYRELHHVNRYISILVGCDLTGYYASLSRLKLQIGGAALAIFVLGLGVGYILVSHSLSPLKQIEGTAGEIADGNLLARIPENVKGRSKELSLLAANLNHTFSRLESLFQRQMRFTADASHELRTPLTVLLAQLELGLKRPRTVEEYQNTLQICLRSGERIRRITKQLIELSRYDAGRVKLDWQRMPLHILLGDLAEELKPFVNNRECQLITDFEPGEVDCDPFRLEQVINNLVNNALQHNEKPITICIRLSFEGGSASIEVIDDGKGIQPENLEKLFDRFFQENPAHAKNRVEENVGLGLAISKAIMQTHNGTLTATSVPGKRTVFCIKLPVKRRNSGADAE